MLELQEVRDAGDDGEVNGGPRQWSIDVGSSDREGVVVKEEGVEIRKKMGRIIRVSKLHHFILQAFQKAPMVLLLVLSAVTLATGIADEGLPGGCLTGSFILVFWILRIASASFYSFYRARKLEQMQVTVIRDGKLQEVRICDIIEGDIVCLTVGNRIPADGFLICDNALVLDGAAQTKTKTGDFRRLCSVTGVLDGLGFVLVTSADADTELSKTIRMVTNFMDDDKLVLEARRKNPNPSADICDHLKKETLVRNWIDEPLAQLGNFALVILITCVVVQFILFSFSGQNRKNNLVQELKGAAGVEGLIKIFKQLLSNKGNVRLLAIFIAPMVFGLQHGIKIVISFCLDKWIGRRGSRGPFCQNSSSASRTLGVTSVICVDLLATLMFQKRAVSRFLIGQEDINGANFSSKMSQTVLEPLIHGVGASILVAGNGSPSTTDGLIISWVEKKWNIDIESDDLKERFEIVSHKKLSSDREGRGVLFQGKGDDENNRVSHWKGGANTILDMCSHYYDWEGQIHKIENQNSEFKQVIKEMECNGMRAIAFAYKQTQLQELVEDGLCLIAIVGVKYECHEKMKSAVRALKNSGRSIKLVSKDKPSTLRAMAGELGLYSPVSTDRAVEIEHRVSMAEKMDQITMMRTSNPKDKLLMIKSLKQKDHVVAFIGGWTTQDAPVLLEADVGITIKTWSTEVTTEISDIVLTSDSSFDSLITLSESGGREYKNIQKFLQIQIISNISALLITAVETIFSGESSLTILHALYLNLVLAFLGGLMLVMEPQHNELRSNRIGKRKDSIITKLMRINILVQVSYQVIIFLVFRFVGEALHIPGVNPMNQDVRKAMIFNGFLLCQVLNHLHPSFDSGTYVIWLLFVPFTSIHVLGFNELFFKLTWIQWASCFLIAALSWGISILLKEKKSR